MRLRPNFKAESSRMPPYRRFPNLLYRRFPNRLGAASIGAEKCRAAPRTAAVPAASSRAVSARFPSPAPQTFTGIETIPRTRRCGRLRYGLYRSRPGCEFARRLGALSNPRTTNIHWHRDDAMNPQAWTPAVRAVPQPSRLRVRAPSRRAFRSRIKKTKPGC
jgi:hypothetical protein